MSNKSQKGFNGTPKARARRMSVISRLEAQLQAGNKPTKENGKVVTVALEEKDTNRIKKEIEVLKKRS